MKCRILALIPLAVFYVRRELDNDLGARESFAAAEEFLSIQNKEFQEFLMLLILRFCANEAFSTNWHHIFETLFLELFQ